MAEDHFDRHLDFYPSQNIFGTKDEIYSDGQDSIKIKGTDVNRIRKKKIGIGSEKKPATIEKIPFEFREYVAEGNKSYYKSGEFIIERVNIYNTGKVEIYFKKNSQLDEEKAKKMLEKLIRQIKGF